MSKNLNIVWNNNRKIQLRLLDNPAAEYIYKSFKFLQHLKLDFINNPKDNPYSSVYNGSDASIDNLKSAANILDIQINVDELDSQNYLNHLHCIYEKNYNGDPNWLVFHEMIHMIEHARRNKYAEGIAFDFREKTDPLIQKFDRSWFSFSTTTVTKGMCYLRWQELGKRPYDYYEDQEPNNIDRICELVKPWIYLRPNIFVAYEDRDRLEGKDLNKFSIWFEKYRKDWTTHWDISTWTPEEIFSVIPIGYIDDIDDMIDMFKNKDYPERIIQ